MRNLFYFCDALMCLLWIVTYTLVLIGTIKYHYPLISPVTQAIIAPFEFSVLIRFIIKGYLGFDYVSISYLYWTAIEVLIIYVMLRHRYVQKKHAALYLLLVCAITCIMCYFVALKGIIFFFSYFNTFIGEVIWFRLILKKDYPMKPLVLTLFITKFIGDAISIPSYFGYGPWLISAICVLLPILDFAFILVYINRSKKKHLLSESQQSS